MNSSSFVYAMFSENIYIYKTFVVVTHLKPSITNFKLTRRVVFLITVAAVRKIVAARCEGEFFCTKERNEQYILLRIYNLKFLYS